MHRILFIDNDKTRLATIQELLKNTSYQISTSPNLKQALKLHKNSVQHIVVCEFNHSIDAVESISSDFNPAKVILIDPAPSTEKAVQAVKDGVFNYLDAGDYSLISQSVIQAIQLDSQHEQHIAGMIGECEAMRQIEHHIHKVAPTNCSVLILGETGTGKELVARAIHSSSRRNHNALICVNCAAIPETLIESELFGYEKGAFTGADTSRQGLIEAAHQGTLFLDEIGELPLEAQARLLRFIQEGEIRRIGSVTPRKVNVRLIAATHRNLKKLCAENRFREDLFYRINVIQMNLPPLRERGADILQIATTLLERYCHEFEHPDKSFSDAAIELIMNYRWPGNIRELENMIARAVILSDREQTIISEELLTIDPLHSSPLKILKPVNSVNSTLSQHHSGETENATDLPPQAQTVTDHPAVNKNLSLEDYFLSFVLKHQDSMSETELARKLGVSRKCLWERRQRLGIPRKKNAKHSN